MGSRPTTAKQLRSAVARLTGAAESVRDETRIFRVVATSCDGKPCPVIFQIGKKTFFKTTSLKQVADAARIPRNRVDELWDWTPQQLLEWLSQYPESVLTSKAGDRKFEEWSAEQERKRAAAGVDATS